MDEIDSILAETTQAETAPSEIDDIDSVLSEIGPVAVDDLGEPLPVGLDGLSPKSAINKSPVDALTRFQMSMGNLEGNKTKLKTMFEEVMEIPDEEGNPTSELAVKKDGLWHRVDAQNGDIRDPWDLAKKYKENPQEFLGDIADLGPLGVAAAVTAAPAAKLGAGAAATAALVSAATAGVRTSLGRIYGTYEATPEEQVQDIAFETILGAGTAKVIDAGVKPTATWLAPKIGKIAEKFKSATYDAGKDIFKKVFAGASIGEEAFDTLVENPNQVSAVLQTFGKATNNRPDLFHNEVTMRQQLPAVKTFLENSQSTMTKIYGGMKNQILNNVDENFSANVDDILVPTYNKAIQSGLGKLVVGNGDDAIELTGVDAIEHLAKRGLRGSRFKLLSQDEIASIAKQSGQWSDDMALLAQNKEAYSAISDMYSRMGVFAGTKGLTGKAAASQLMDIKRQVSDVAYNLEYSEAAQNAPKLKMLLAEARHDIRKAFRDKIKQSSPKNVNLVDEIDTTYNTLSEQLAPLVDKWNKYKQTGNPEILQQTLSHFTAKPGKQVATKFGVDALRDAAAKYNIGNVAKEIDDAKLAVQVGETAKKLVPLKSIWSPTIMSMAGGAAVSGNPAVAATILAGNSLRSPMTARAVAPMARVGGAAERATINAMFQSRDFIIGLAQKGELDKFLASPDAVAAFTAAVLQVPQVTEAAKEQIMTPIMGPR